MKQNYKVLTLEGCGNCKTMKVFLGTQRMKEHQDRFEFIQRGEPGFGLLYRAAKEQEYKTFPLIFDAEENVVGTGFDPNVIRELVD